MAVTPKVTSSTSPFSSAANTRLGDGIRATASPQVFTPITESPVSSEVALKDQGLRQDDWSGMSASRDGAASQEDSSPQKPEGVPVRLGKILASNDVSRVMFFLQSRPGGEPWRPVSAPLFGPREGSALYESNTRVVMARFTGRKDPGGQVDRYL
ncbi:hypothetical protein [Pararhodospirillum oryzae]|uniref:Uncharacterized protein n=1 Tax=Pararhodospirillum oryzae TaxID=478448 RepID=A0A512HBE9_9PROT|nr:hypothetical protein [Pararhodospirillum oryzae]GEO82786.1 hypothetical protein ROR02_29170 [Pararhodospirillum oryzae]